MDERGGGPDRGALRRAAGHRLYVHIWFTTELLSHFEERPAECAFYHVQSDGERVGIVSKGTHPRSDTVAALRGKINDLIQHARKATGEAQQALIENMRMTELPEIRCDRAKATVEKIMPVHDRCCRYIASHSQPRETLNVRPSRGTGKLSRRRERPT